jgi:hypothetical protein
MGEGVSHNKTSAYGILRKIWGISTGFRFI